jgi:hypothetical protein
MVKAQKLLILAGLVCAINTSISARWACCINTSDGFSGTEDTFCTGHDSKKQCEAVCGGNMCAKVADNDKADVLD